MVADDKAVLARWASVKLVATHSKVGEKSGQRSLLFAVPWSLKSAGGVNVVVRALLSGTSERARVQALLLVSDWAHKRPRVEDADGSTEIRIRMRPLLIPGRIACSLLGFVAELPQSLWSLGRIHRTYGVAGTNVHYPGLWCSPLVVLRRFLWGRGRLVLSFHGSDLSAAARATGLERRAMRWIVQRADAVTACSSSLAADVEKVFELTSDSVRVVHNGADIRGLETDIAACDPATPNRPAHRWLLNIGTFEPKKGQDVLIRALAALLPSFPDLGVMLVGRTGAYLSDLRALARDLGVEDRVVFQEDVRHPDIASYLKAASVFVLPSRREPFGIATVEAGVAGLPVVASRVGGIPEVIDSESVGVLVEPDDPNALAEAIAGLLRDPERRQRLGAALRARVRERFSWDRTCEGYLDAVLPEWREAGRQGVDG